MAGYITDYFGYPINDQSDAAMEAAQRSWCPFLDDTCTKNIQLDGVRVISGACAVQQVGPGAPEVICCPHRLYADEYQMLRDVAKLAFKNDYLLSSGRQALTMAASTGVPTIAVFGHRWGGELRLPKMDGRSNYFVDWVLALLAPNGELKDFCAIEVQTIDTTGNYRDSRRALTPPQRSKVKSEVGLNWENVNKRILPQIIYKAQVLARESRCRSGMFFVTPVPVYDAIMARLGGVGQVQQVGSLQPSSITFLAYDFDNDKGQDGAPRPLMLARKHMSTHFEVQQAFNRAKLPDQNVYGRAISEALGFEFRALSE